MVPETELNRFAGPIMVVIVNVVLYKRQVIVHERFFFFGRNGTRNIQHVEVSIRVRVYIACYVRSDVVVLVSSGCLFVFAFFVTPRASAVWILSRPHCMRWRDTRVEHSSMRSTEDRDAASALGRRLVTVIQHTLGRFGGKTPVHRFMRVFMVALALFFLYFVARITNTVYMCCHSCTRMCGVCKWRIHRGD